jgi:hypothetical protein
MISSIIAICPLTLDVLIAAWTWGNGPENSDVVKWGQNLSNMTTSRIALVLLTIIFSIVILSIRKPSIILSVLLLFSVIVSIFLPWLMEGKAQSIGGAVGFFFLLVSLIGSLMLLADSLIYLGRNRIFEDSQR